VHRLIPPDNAEQLEEYVETHENAAQKSREA
jgi:hypothetical protein